MSTGNPLVTDIESGTILTYGMVEEPSESMLWSLKREQDRHFLARILGHKDQP